MTIADSCNVDTHPSAPASRLHQKLHPNDSVWLQSNVGYVGRGREMMWNIAPDPERFSTAESLFLSHATEGKIAFGSFTFDPQSPGSVVIIPEKLEQWSAASISTNPPPRKKHQPTVDDSAEWMARVDAAITAIKAGDVDKIVLARDVVLEFAELIDVPTVLAQLATRFGNCYTFAVDGLVGSTPELLIRRQGWNVESLMLAGSAARGDDAQKDAALGASLLASEKDRDEHQLAVASLRTALAPLCEDLTVDAEPHLMQLDNVQHLATRARGLLVNPPPSALALVAALHPTAAVCGTPTAAALDAIRDLEGIDRGRYAGPVGWMDTDGNGEWGIALRCAEIGGTRARLFAGCGIVAESDPASELAETELKLDPMRKALGV